ncbi:MAG TPA: sensor domain-containing diguanylate cyclase [Elusimicrobiota bacterium]|nr:sensor domain-containing diguanylate cyclase [Elusimicrobiota bacterium]
MADLPSKTGRRSRAEFDFDTSDFCDFPVTHWRSVLPELHGVFERAFFSLRRHSSFDMGAVFLFDPEAQLFRTAKIISGGEMLDGEEEMPLPPKSPMWRLIRRETDFLVLGPPDNAAFLPLAAFGTFLGALRVDRGRARKPFTRTERDFLVRFADALSTAMWRVNYAVHDRLRDNQLRTFSEVSVLIHQSLRLKKLLEDVARKIVKNLGMDRVKIFLVDRKRKSLQGELGYTLSEGLVDITDEKYPLKADGNPLVDALVGNPRNPMLTAFRQPVRYIPLRARNEVMGVFMVDNLLSQQEISQDELRLLETLAGQLGLAVKNAELYEGVEELSITDELTRLYLPRYFKERLEQECQRSARADGSFAICMLDVDRFKNINDTYGHPIGDRVLQELAKQLRAASRQIDVVCRYGGDEFIILLPNTKAEQALQFAQRLRLRVRDVQIPLPHEQALQVGVSIGIAVYPEHSRQAEELIRLADTALYGAKSGGRNDARLYSPDARRQAPEINDVQPS